MDNELAENGRWCESEAVLDWDEILEDFSVIWSDESDDGIGLKPIHRPEKGGRADTGDDGPGPKADGSLGSASGS